MALLKKHLNKTTHWKKLVFFYWQALKQMLVNNTLKSHFALLSRHLLLTILRGYSLWWESTLFAIIESCTIKQQDFLQFSWFHRYSRLLRNIIMAATACPISGRCVFQPNQFIRLRAFSVSYSDLSISVRNSSLPIEANIKITKGSRSLINFEPGPGAKFNH